MNALRKINRLANGEGGRRFLIAELWVLAIAAQFVIWREFHMTIFGIVMDALLLAMISTVFTLLLWPFLILLRKAAVSVFPRRAALLLRFGRFPYYAGTVFVLFLGPHLWMSAKLTPLRDEFAKIARGGESATYFTGEHSDGRPVNALDYGGRLDRVVATRSIVLAKYQFIPVFTAKWEVSTGDVFGPRMFGGYVYTFLPRSAYRNMLAYVISKFPPKISSKEAREEIDRDLARINL